ncbi:uncharacterized protein F5147DRAFT_589923, partial [Suillus discolor]
FSKDSMLHTVVEFIVCDDQSLAVANKTTFRNCLVAMHPASTTAELPSTHNITTYIRNAFIKLIKGTKANIQVSFFIDVIAFSNVF